MSKIHAGPWSGALTENSILVKASVKAEITNGSLIISKTADFASPTEFPATFAVIGGYENKIFECSATGLSPSTQYHYRVKLNGSPESSKTGKFHTAPTLGTAAGFRFGFASCGNAGFLAGTSSTAAYEALRKTPGLLFFFHLGDLHYENLTTDEVPRRLKAYDEKIAQVGIGELFREMPVPYTWDDHDFLGDDSRGADPAISANTPKARLAYDLFVPHYSLPADSGIYYSFQIGRVPFIATDSRSFQRPAQEMLGSRQLEWFKGELLRGKELDLIVWANSTPWVMVSSNPADDDDWGGHAAERAAIGQFIKDKNIRNLCMISGDAHMLAIDDGTNTGYAAGGKGGFPLFHVGALQSDGSKKGGPYSHGTFKGNRQYGTCEVGYDAVGKAHIVWGGWNAGSSTTDPEKKVQYEFDAAATYAEF